MDFCDLAQILYPRQHHLGSSMAWLKTKARLSYSISISFSFFSSKTCHKWRLTIFDDFRSPYLCTMFEVFYTNFGVSFWTPAPLPTLKLNVIIGRSFSFFSYKTCPDDWLFMTRPTLKSGLARAPPLPSSADYGCSQTTYLAEKRGSRAFGWLSKEQRKP